MRVQERRGFHAAVVSANASSRACISCHSEHNGDNFALVHWDPKAFHHVVTGFTLDGKHATLACAQCHNAEKIVPAERGTIAVRDLNRTYLGLSRNCASCHEDKHRGQLGANCLQCHNTTDWKAARFDHSRTRFPLTGAHLEVGCQKCHTPSVNGTLRYTGLKFDQCAACHSDPHRGAFEQKCESCHSTSAWRQTTFTARFDHASTKFPLLGKHASLRCDTCHRGDDFKTPIAHQFCADCHKDYHNGQFAKRADGGNCESCHTVDGFKSATFGLDAHSRTGFPLRGKHATIPCAQCHKPAGQATLFLVKFASCIDCHQDVHQGQFAGHPYANRCEQCHNEDGFHPSTFTLARHQQIRFALGGGHMAVACNECHKPAPGAQLVPYHFAGLSCTTCHADPHRGQFAARMVQIGSGGSALGCEACHSTERWQDVSRFDHETTKFRLAGAHRAVACAECHRPPSLERTLMNVDFRAAPLVCEQCHEDPHDAQFARGSTTHCADCHTSAKWRPSLFDHEKTAFSLKGAHQNVRCASCHTNVRLVEGRKVLFYKPAPTKCDACHGNVAAGSGS